MWVPALYFPNGNKDETPLVIHPRKHSKMIQVGDAKGTRFHYSEIQDIAPRILFMLAEVPEPADRAVVMLTINEGYRLHDRENNDFISVTSNATAMSESEALLFVYPGHVDWPITMWSPYTA